MDNYVPISFPDNYWERKINQKNELENPLLDQEYFGTSKNKIRFQGNCYFDKFTRDYKDKKRYHTIAGSESLGLTIANVEEKTDIKLVK